MRDTHTTPYASPHHHTRILHLPATRAATQVAACAVLSPPPHSTHPPHPAGLDFPTLRRSCRHNAEQRMNMPLSQHSLLHCVARLPTQHSGDIWFRNGCDAPPPTGQRFGAVTMVVLRLTGSTFGLPTLCRPLLGTRVDTRPPAPFAHYLFTLLFGPGCTTYVVLDLIPSCHMLDKPVTQQFRPFLTGSCQTMSGFAVFAFLYQRHPHHHPTPPPHTTYTRTYHCILGPAPFTGFS